MKLPILSGRKLLRVLRRNGFCAVRQKGSHVFVESADGLRVTVIPIHAGEDLGKGILKSILNDLELEVEDLHRMLQ